jgi:hypothetical protein
MYFHKGSNSKGTESNTVKNIADGSVVKKWFMVVPWSFETGLALGRRGCTGARHRRKDKNVGRDVRDLGRSKKS